MLRVLRKTHGCSYTPGIMVKGATLAAFVTPPPLPFDVVRRPPTLRTSSPQALVFAGAWRPIALGPSGQYHCLLGRRHPTSGPRTWSRGHRETSNAREEASEGGPVRLIGFVALSLGWDAQGFKDLVRPSGSADFGRISPNSVLLGFYLLVQTNRFETVWGSILSRRFTGISACFAQGVNTCGGPHILAAPHIAAFPLARFVGEVLVFFDEINAANCMALFKTIIIDRMYGNKYIPENAP